MSRYRSALALSATAMLILGLVGPGRPAGASPAAQCGNACGIPGCQTCSMELGLSRCDGWCSDADDGTGVFQEVDELTYGRLGG